MGILDAIEDRWRIPLDQLPYGREWPFRYGAQWYYRVNMRHAVGGSDGKGSVRTYKEAWLPDDPTFGSPVLLTQLDFDRVLALSDERGVYVGPINFVLFKVFNYTIGKVDW